MLLMVELPRLVVEDSVPECRALTQSLTSKKGLELNQLVFEQVTKQKHKHALEKGHLRYYIIDKHTGLYCKRNACDMRHKLEE